MLSRQRPRLPLLEGHALGNAKVPFEDLHLLARELLVDDVETCLVVQAERPVVEIGRAYRNQQIVDDKDLGVEHRRLILVHLGTCRKQVAPQGA